MNILPPLLLPPLPPLLLPPVLPPFISVFKPVGDENINKP